MTNFLRFLGCCLMLTAVSAAAGDKRQRVILFPKLSVGQIIRYQVGWRETTSTHTESSVAAPMAPAGGQTDSALIFQVEVEDLRSQAGQFEARLRTRIIEPNAAPLSAIEAPNSVPGNSSKNTKSLDKSSQSGKLVELTLHGDGQVTDVQGLGKLSPGELTAWREWIERFADGAAFPEKGVKPGEKWKREEPIANSSLAGLSWEKDSEYVTDAPCAAMRLTPQGDPAAAPQPQETCAVILTNAVLKQKSSPKNATPEDYKLHDLRNTGVANGKNQIISYFSLETGLLVRSTEDADQSMNLTVATADGSNRVHYTMKAESHARVQLLADPPGAHP
ncbi:MAG: hypothetical protein WCE61_21715 [Candidatus Acidiferrum sp.]